MKIYLSHATAFDYQGELYAPVRESDFNSQHEIILPHEGSNTQFSSKKLFQEGCDLVIAEVSYPSMGVGIELGWADCFNIPVVAIHQQGKKPSGSIGAVAMKTLSYIHGDVVSAGRQAIAEAKN